MNESNSKEAFEQAGKKRHPNLLVELYLLLKHNKKYWMIPILLVLLAFGLLIVLGGTAAAPFIYTIF